MRPRSSGVVFSRSSVCAIKELLDWREFQPIRSFLFQKGDRNVYLSERPLERNGNQLTDWFICFFITYQPYMVYLISKPILIWQNNYNFVSKYRINDFPTIPMISTVKRFTVVFIAGGCKYFRRICASKLLSRNW